MALRIYLAHSGRVLQADPISFASPDALKSWIHSETQIGPDRQILITGRGKNVRQQSLLTETEVFVFDKHFIATSSGSLPPDIFPPSPLSLPPPPATLNSQKSLIEWYNLFRARRDWALELAEAVSPYRRGAQQALAEADNIRRASSLALDNLQSHVRNIRSKFEDKTTWAQGVIEDHESILSDWAGCFQLLEQLPARNEFAFLLQAPRTPTKDTAQRRSGSTEYNSLGDLINKSDVEKAASELTVAADDVKRRLEVLTTTMEDISTDNLEVEALIRLTTNTPEPEDVQDLYSNVEAVTRKIVVDYEEVTQLPHVQESVQTASRRALSHTRDLLPSLQRSAAEISDIARQMIEQRNVWLESSTVALRTISRVQSRLADFQAQIFDFQLVPEHTEAFDVVRTVFDIPVTYGCILVESIRRSEWSANLRADTDQIETELKAETSEEARRRKKWTKSMGGLVIHSSATILPGAVKSASGLDTAWPLSDRQEIFKYIDALRSAHIDDAVQHLTHLLKELDTSTSRRRRPRAFKTGSVHDADLALGRSSILQEGDGEAAKLLRSEKSRLEDKLRASDSRIRKLEDLLHRHGQMNRATSANFGPPSEVDRRPHSSVGLPSPRQNELPSRKSSVSSRRLSSNQNPDEKTLVQRIVGLEADLYAERETIVKLHREAQADRRACIESRDRTNDAESTKRDLLANFESQRQEFDNERQLLEDEMHKLKIRSEEMEDELDRVLGSRAHQGLTSNTTIAALQAEIERLSTESSEKLMVAHRQADLVETDLGSERNRVNGLEDQLQRLRRDTDLLQAERVKLADQLRNQENAQDEHRSSLQAAHSHLFPGGVVPNDLGRLATAVETLSEGMAIHTRTADEATQLAAVEKKALEEQIREVTGQLEQTLKQLNTSDQGSLSLRDTIAEERVRYGLSQDELAALKDDLQILLAKLAVDETGSETLRARVTEEEHKTIDLSEKLAVAESSAQNSKQEMLIWKDKGSSLAVELEHLKNRLDARGVRAKDLSQRLLSNNDRIVRTLEQMGYSILRQDDRLVIRRSSKVNASTASIAEGASTIHSPSAQVPITHYSNPSDLDTLYWMSETDGAAENDKFRSFISTLSRVDIDAAAEMMTKRHKDVETLARKYQKDSRAYREKAHRLHGEAHDKIAYRTFKEGDLALFLPTRNQVTRPWAAFNVGAPHYFLREQDSHKLPTRDWLLARINKVEERVVDLSKSLVNGHHAGLTNSPSMANDRHSINTEASDHGSSRSVDDENPFELSDGLRWYLIDASEEKPGIAPLLTPGLGRSTVAATNVDVTGSIRLIKEGKKTRDLIGTGNGSVSATMATKTLTKSLDSHSRRSSSASKRGHGASPSRTSNAAAAAAIESSGIESSSHPSPSHANADANANTSSDLPLSNSHRSIQAQPADSPSKGTAREDAAIFESEMASAQPREVQNGLESTQDLRYSHTAATIQPETTANANANANASRYRTSTSANASPTKQRRHQQRQQRKDQSPLKSRESSQSLQKDAGIRIDGGGEEGGGGGAGTGGGWEWDKLWNLDYQL